MNIPGPLNVRLSSPGIFMLLSVCLNDIKAADRANPSATSGVFFTDYVENDHNP